jgi:hypothetical protein
MLSMLCLVNGNKLESDELPDVQQEGEEALA